METSAILSKNSEIVISRLNCFECSSIVVDRVVGDLNWEFNRSKFIQICNEKNFLETLKILELATESHINQTYKRNKDANGLSNIPYINHPIEMANIAAKLNFGESIVSGCILHDVIEDTNTTIKDLKLNKVPNKIQKIVVNVTKYDRETRSEYFERVFSSNSLDSKIVKLLDRYHNLIRGFTLTDPDYLQRLILETKMYFLPQFQITEIAKLSDLEKESAFLIKELEKYRSKLLENTNI
jgi:(p)ppGpp synthase/HD superfamily hydrolase